MSSTIKVVEIRHDRAFRIIRAFAGLSQAELSEMVGLDASYISLIESGKRTPSFDAVGSLVRTVGLPPWVYGVLAGDPNDTEESVAGAAYMRLAKMGAQ